MRKFAILLTVVFAFACTKDEFPFPYDADNPITGAWELVSRHFVGYDTKTGTVMYSNFDNRESDSYIMLTPEGTVYLGSPTDESKRLNIGTYQFTGDSIFFDTNTIPNERQAVLELERRHLKLEFIRDDGSEDGTLDVTTHTYKRREQ